MPSSAFTTFLSIARETNKLDTSKVTNDMSLQERQVFYHACIALDVAAWDGYINSVVFEFHKCIGTISNPSLISYRDSISGAIEASLKRFNTPNFDNTRNLLIECTGYDPVAVWDWPARNMVWQTVQYRLNAMLKIRHSFAHGFALPRYDFLPSRAGTMYLNKRVVEDNERMLVHLARKLDIGLRRHLISTFQNECLPWPK